MFLQLCHPNMYFLFGHLYCPVVAISGKPFWCLCITSLLVKLRSSEIGIEGTGEEHLHLSTKWPYCFHGERSCLVFPSAQGGAFGSGLHPQGRQGHSTLQTTNIHGFPHVLLAAAFCTLYILVLWIKSWASYSPCTPIPRITGSLWLCCWGTVESPEREAKCSKLCLLFLLGFKGHFPRHVESWEL